MFSLSYKLMRKDSATSAPLPICRFHQWKLRLQALCWASAIRLICTLMLICTPIRVIWYTNFLKLIPLGCIILYKA
ncbi:hypothetical protein FF1_033021 [Malus domestica]